MKDPSHCRVSPKFLSGVMILICVWYVTLCAVHFLSQRPLWLDEYNVFRSVKDFTPGQMFRERLLAGQIFPRLSLLLIQKISQPWEFSLQSLRLMSFLALISGFFIWLRIASREFKDKIQLLTFTLSWASSVLLIYYSAELKPYAMDVLTGAVFLWFLYQQNDLQRKRQTLYATLLFFLPFLVVLSYPVYLFLIFPLYNMIRSRVGKKFLAIYGLALSLAGATSFFFDIRASRANAETQGFMDYTVSFASFGEFFRTAWEGTANLFFRWFAERPRIVKKIALSFTTFGLIRDVVS